MSIAENEKLVAVLDNLTRSIDELRLAIGRRADLDYSTNILDPDVADSGLFDNHLAAAWDTSREKFVGLVGLDTTQFSGPAFDELIGIDSQKRALLTNSLAFASGHEGNNALLWGVRGAGKSSLVKATFRVAQQKYDVLRLIEMTHLSIDGLRDMFARLRKQQKFRFVLFFDDLNFDGNSTELGYFKTLQEGGIAGAPENTVIYATSNRRHIVSREATENERENAMSSTDVSEERLSLSDRFGLWLGFHSIDQEQYLEIALADCRRLGITDSERKIKTKAIAWSRTRGVRSGRAAHNFAINYLAANHLAAN